MSNLYFHFPFCKQACHYCNFHFSTNTKNQDSLWKAMNKELTLRSEEINSPLESIYFGGGSPSLLDPKQIEEILTTVQSQFKVNKSLEITLEVNPDDVSAAYLSDLKYAGINRLSLGVQSFLDKDLILMNRAHKAAQAFDALDLISKKFTNYTLDLIYGLPYSTQMEWEQNLDLALSYNPPHLSAYALTVEKKRPYLHKSKIKKCCYCPKKLLKININ